MIENPKIDDKVIFCDGSKMLQGYISAIYKGKIFHVKTKEGDYILHKEELFDGFFDIYEKCYEVTEEWEKLHYYSTHD